MESRKEHSDRYWIHIVLFLLTVLATMYSGAQMVGRYAFYESQEAVFTLFEFPFTAAFLLDGLKFSTGLLLFLAVHEFGHYFAARKHNVLTSLPYFIPFPLTPIGTFGAVIRIKEPIPSTTKLFDIGASGPMAGFVVAVGVLLYGFGTLPSLDYVSELGGHESLLSYINEFGAFPTEMSVPSGVDAPESALLVVGTTPLYWMLTQFFDNVPPLWEMYHYPFLFAGWLGLFFTAVNLLPVGQLDGGHMLYALVGPKWHTRLARAFVIMLLISGGIGYLTDMGPSIAEMIHGWFSIEGADTLTTSWIVLSAIMLFYLQRIFNRKINIVIPAFFGVLGSIAVLSWSPWVVGTIGYSGWLFWCLLIVVLIRVEHPPVMIVEPLTTRRKIVAIAGLLIFALCFSIKPLYFVL